jgi:hypothetical protein
MSYIFKLVDLSAAIVGTHDIVDLTPAGINFDPAYNEHPAHFRCFNESGCGLIIGFDATTATGYTVIAGGQPVIPVPNGAVKLLWNVVYALPNPPVTSLFLQYFAPNEPINDTGILGNSPIGIAGSVATTSTNVLKNDGNAPGTQFIESTPSDQGVSSININNDGSGLWQILSAGTMRTIMNMVRGNSGVGKATITFGDSGDPSITTFNGNLVGGSFLANVLSTISLVASSSSNTDSLAIQRTGSFGTGGFVMGVQSNGMFYLYDTGNGGSVFANASRSQPILVNRSAGGGSVGTYQWVGTTDPGGSALEGDTWDNV